MKIRPIAEHCDPVNAELRGGENVELINEEGRQKLYGVVCPDSTYISTDITNGQSVQWWRNKGWKVKLRGPRLPEEPGLYVSVGTRPDERPDAIFLLAPGGRYWFRYGFSNEFTPSQLGNHLVGKMDARGLIEYNGMGLEPCREAGWA